MPRVRPDTAVGIGNARQALIRAAIEIIGESGAANIGLRDAARRAGVTHGAPYRHFKDRASLVAAVAEEGFHALRAASSAAIRKASSDPRTKLKALGMSYVLFALENPGYFRVMFGPEAVGHTPQVRTAEAAVFSQCVALVEEAQLAGVVAEGDPRELALAAWSGVHGLAELTLGGLVAWVGLRSDRRRLADRMTTLFFRGIATRPP